MPGEDSKLSNSRVGPGESQVAAENRAESAKLGKVPAFTPVITVVMHYSGQQYSGLFRESGHQQKKQ